MQKLVDFFEETYNVFVLPLSNSRLRPGAILDTTWNDQRSWIHRRLRRRRQLTPSFGRVRGYAWEILQDPEDDYPIEFYSGSILVGQLTDRFDFSAGLDLASFGIKIGPGLDRAITARLEIDDVKKCTFRLGFTGDRLRRELRRLKDSGDSRYIDVDENYLVIDTYFLHGLRWTFNAESAAALRAQMESATIEATSGGDLRWVSERVLEFGGSPDVPVAFDGLKI